MTLIELLVFLCWVVGGAWAAHNIAQLFAPAYVGWCTAGGALWGLFMLFFGMRWIFSKLDHKPYCRCGGKVHQDFKMVADPDWEYVHRCEKCGARFLWRKGILWFEVMEDNSARLFLKQDFLCKWKQATEKDIANKQIQPIATKRGSG